jgi:hypothetical protein
VMGSHKVRRAWVDSFRDLGEVAQAVRIREARESMRTHAGRVRGGLAEPEPLDEPEPLMLVLPACATSGLDEPPQSAANRPSPTATASAGAIRAIRFLICGRFLCWACALTALTRRRESQAVGVDRLLCGLELRRGGVHMRPRADADFDLAIARDLRIGEFRHTVRAHANGVLEARLELLRLLLRALPAAVGQQPPARLLCVGELGRARVDSVFGAVAEVVAVAVGPRIGEVR